MASLPCVEDTCSVDLGFTVDSKLTADVLYDVDMGLDCDDANGLFVKVNGSVCNAIALTPGGLFYPSQTVEFAANATAIPFGFQQTAGFVYGYGLDTATLAANPGSPFNGAPGTVMTTIGSATLTNTNACRDMAYFLIGGIGAMTAGLDEGVAVEIAAQIRRDGGPWGAWTFVNSFRGTIGSPLATGQVGNQGNTLPSNPFIPAKLVLTPGQSVTIENRLICTLLNPTAGLFQGFNIGAGFTMSIWGLTL